MKRQVMLLKLLLLFEANSMSARGDRHGHGEHDASEDVEQLVIKDDALLVELSRHLLHGEESATGLDVATSGFHALPATAEHHLLDGGPAEEVSGRSAVTKRMRHVRNMTHAERDGRGP